MLVSSPLRISCWAWLFAVLPLSTRSQSLFQPTSLALGSEPGPVQIEVKYSEEIWGLAQNFSDGPFPYATALANTYRVETFEIAEPGRIESFFLQGGQRWQSIRLLTDGDVTFDMVGLVPSIPVVDIDDLPGSFTSDDETLNQIWKLGARAVVAACLEPGSQKTMWEIDEEGGAYVRGMRAGTTSMGTFFRDYTLEFDTKIERGGVGWTVAFPVASPARGIQLNLVAENQVFVNTNTTLTRPNSISFDFGYSMVNVTTLTSWHLDTFDVPFSVEEDTWYRIKTVLDGTHLAVSIGDVDVFNVSLSDYYISDSRLPGGTIDSLGSWGFGGWQDQIGYFRNVVVYDTANGSELYRNPLTDASEDGVIREYGVMANRQAAYLDGPKRDRLVWLSDFLHTVRIIGASTSRYDLVKGTLQFIVDWQSASGLLPYAAAIGHDPGLAKQAFAFGGGSYFAGSEIWSIILPDYQILGVLAFTNYVRPSNDVDFARTTWLQWKANMAINSTTGLLSLFGAFLGPSDGGSAINCALVEALNTMAEVATVLGEDSDAEEYTTLSTGLALAINSNLWNEDLGIYGLSPANMSEFSVNSIAFCTTSGTATPEKTSRFISALGSLELSPGFKDSTEVNASDPSTNISPNTNGFLLSALLSQGTSDAAKQSLELIKSLWTPMLADNRTSTGASWEYVNLDEGPGLGLFTSLSHPWGGAPTYVLTEWAAGIQAAEGVDGFGYRSWVVAPQMGVYMGLEDVSARVVTAFDGDLAVHWQVENGTMAVTILAPSETRGVFRLGQFEKSLSGCSEYNFSLALPM
ncbi:Six-hairpin glycosidase-like protein [Hypoxylon crocopeplum]|nr:Six-hairpin glycosidase-like protein [Hypoxylon crocopeplum]